MTEYYIPTGHGEAELVEKRSRFIGQVWRVSSEEEARARMERTIAWQRDHDVWTVYQKAGRQAIRLGRAGGAVAWDLAGNQHRPGAGLCGPGLWAAASGAADGDRPGTGRNGVPLLHPV